MFLPGDVRLPKKFALREALKTSLSSHRTLARRGFASGVPKSALFVTDDIFA
jgi:hypothetical protein